MKKKIVILLVVLVVTIGVCVGAYFLFTREDETVISKLLTTRY